MSLGCIQALKCNTNKCPTGIATQDELLMAGLDPDDKMVRVFNFHKKTIEAACDLLGAMGKRWKGVWLSLKYVMMFQSFRMDLFFSFLFSYRLQGFFTNLWG